MSFTICDELLFINTKYTEILRQLYHKLSAYLLQDPDEQVSILDKDPGAKAMLALVGRGPVSDGLRETDATAESPEQHELPPL